MEVLGDVVQRQRGYPCRSELDRQGYAIETTTDVSDGGRIGIGDAEVGPAVLARSAKSSMASSASDSVGTAHARSP